MAMGTAVQQQVAMQPADGDEAQPPGQAQIRLGIGRQTHGAKLLPIADLAADTA